MEEEMEEAMGGTKDLATTNNNNIVKGKRTKRQKRPQSPIPLFSFLTPSNSTSKNDNNDYNQDDDDDQDIYNPSTSEFDEEEEDMANCLILLAQGGPHHVSSKRYTSKKFVEYDGTYVYQCKTCDRTFSSFQALGGHRASHRKPKGEGSEPEEKKIRRQLSFLSSDIEDEKIIKERKMKKRVGSTNSLMQMTNRGGEFTKLSPKIHECGICGAEFSSGQALGGHMRRHRGSTNALVVEPLTEISGFESEPEPEMKRSKSLLSLDLDLNLPAQPQPDEEIQKQKQKQSQNQTALVLSTGTLVDCHY